jgi:hypothetical protein
MKPAISMAFVLQIAALVCCLNGCSKGSDVADDRWARPLKIAESWDGLVGSAQLFRHNNLICALIPQRNSRDMCLLMQPRDETNGLWVEIPVEGVPYRYRYTFGAVDSVDSRMWFQCASVDGQQLRMGFILASLTSNSSLKIESETSWIQTREAFFGQTGSSVTLLEPYHGWGIMRGAKIYIPFCLDAETRSGNTEKRTHFFNGVFRSDDYGNTWQLDKVSDLDSSSPMMVGTREFDYFFAEQGDRSLWYSRKSAAGNSWEPPQIIAKAYARGLAGHVARADQETLHYCWLDSRNEKSRLSLQDPYRRNYEVAYCRRRDSDAVWSKDAILSKGMFYAYSPSMSVEGNKVVVAWSGLVESIRSHGETRPSDVYYVTSDDAGDSWSKPKKITDRAKDGITSGRPQVVLLDGTIHLLYVQGKLSFKQESPGLVKLNQPPWPIYYTQRPFPK